jgi:hypothetical protein
VALQAVTVAGDEDRDGGALTDGQVDGAGDARRMVTVLPAVVSAAVDSHSYISSSTTCWR